MSDSEPGNEPARLSAEGDPRAASQRVQQLPDALIDQIAAGEVVERPASVVKELVENALDAGATRVRVEVRGGGRDFIAVSDDGSGMNAADARLALRRHATSKISSSDDLERIATYGFRGEALPAIASVSRLRIRTRTHEAATALEIRVEEGRVVTEREVGGPSGTRVEIADIFRNVPARRKFLKKESTEWGHIADWLARSALALPGVHFEVRRDDRPAIVWPAVSNPLDRVAAVVSEEDAAAFVSVDSRAGLASDDTDRCIPRLHGFASRPDRHRATPAGIYFFVNRRPVRDRLMQHALVDVYRDILPRGRYPAAVLFLDVPTQDVDVNVHPAKWEVRFADPRAVHQLIRHAVRSAIAERSWIGGALPSGETRATTGEGGQRAPAVFSNAKSDVVVSSATDWIFARDGGAEGLPARASSPDLFADDPERRASADGAEQLGQPTATSVRFGELPLLGQLLATYLVVESKEGLVLIDQHAAHERVLYERLRAEWVDAGVERQGLLVPLTIQLVPRAMAALVEAAEGVAKLGFEIDPFGENTVVVRALPALLAGRDPGGLVRGLSDELADRNPGTDASRPESRVLESADRIFATLACHAARRKGEVLAEPERRALLDALDAIPWAPTCPHGRPVAVPIGLAEIERRFSRR